MERFNQKIYKQITLKIQIAIVYKSSRQKFHVSPENLSSPGGKHISRVVHLRCQFNEKLSHPRD